MTTWTKTTIKFIVLALAALALVAVVIGSVDVRQLGRTNPKRAANFRLPWFNFSETYTDGKILGVSIGATRAEAIHAAEDAGFEVEPSGWGDARAGGASLYSRSALLAAIAGQPNLYFYNHTDLKNGMRVTFRQDRVVSVNVYYINFEAI